MQRLKSNISFLFILTAIITLIIISISCNDNPVGPGNEPPPGRRDYTWTVDTLISPMWIAEKMWGSSPHNVWVIGGGGGSMERIWHYDGTYWKNPGGVERVGPPRAIYGLGENKMWVGGVDGQITFYDGNSWTESYRYTPENSAFVSIEDIYGHKENDVYAVGLYAVDDGSNQTRGFILHYDGVEWKEVYKADYHSYFYRIFPYGKKTYYIEEIRLEIFPDEPEYIGITKFDGEKVTSIFMKSIPEIGSWAELLKVGEEIYFVTKKQIYQLRDDRLIPFLKIDNPNFYYGIIGSNKHNIFLSMSDGIAHFNGNNIEYLMYYPEGEVRLTGGMVFQDEVFFVGISNATYLTHVYHGKTIETK